MSDVLASIPKLRPRRSMSPSVARIIARPTGWCREIALDFELDPERTQVRATLKVERNGDHDRPLRLDGDGLDAARGAGRRRRCALDDGRRRAGHRARRRRRDGRDRGRDRARRQHQADGPLRLGRDALHPVRGEGFRRITFFPDRPDVLSRYRVRMERRQGALPGPARQRQSASPAGDGDGRHATGPSGTIRSPSRAICSRWSPATSPPTATASPP